MSYILQSCKIKVYSYNPLPIEKALTLHNVIALIKVCINYLNIMIINQVNQNVDMLIKQMNQKTVVFVTIGTF